MFEKCSRGRAANRARGRLRKCCRSVAGRAEKRSRSHRRAPLTEKRLRNDERRCVARSAIIPPHRWISRIAPGRRIASWRIAAVVVIAEIVLVFRSILRIAVGVRESFGPHLASLATNCFVLAANVVRASVFCARLAANEVRADVRQIFPFVEILRELPEPHEKNSSLRWVLEHSEPFEPATVHMLLPPLHFGLTLSAHRPDVPRLQIFESTFPLLVVRCRLGRLSRYAT